MTEQATPVDVRSMTPEQAGQHLSKMKLDFDLGKAISEAGPGRELRARIKDDPDFRKNFLAGDGKTKAEVANLIAQKIDPAAVASKVDQALSGSLSTSGFSHANSPDGVSPQNLLSAVASFREIGISDAAIRELLVGQKTDRETYQRVEQLRTELLRDPEWRARWLAGGELERQQAVLFSIVRVNGFKRD
jgi:hypothetical protein